MEENLGRTTVDVDVLLAPARKQLDELRTMTERSAGDAGDAGGRSLGARLAAGVGSAMAAVGKTVAIGAAAGLVALGGLGIAGAKAGLQTAAAMEQADIAFTTMLGSGEKADSFLQDLAAFAAKTPFEFPELQTAASSLISAGVQADKVIPIMTSLGNATSGMGTGAEGVKRATIALQQMSAAGKITGEDLNQLRDAGVPVFDLLAAATGKSVAQVAELAQKGKLGKKELEQLMSALESGKGLERFSGLMDQQSQSLNGMFSTLKDTVNMGLAKAIEPLLPMIKDGLGGATAFAAAQLPKLAAGLATVASWAQVAYGILFQGDFQGGLVAGLEEDSGAVNVLFNIREAALGVYNILFKGDFSGPFLGLQEDSRAVDVLFKIREAALSVFEAVRSGDLSSLGTAFGSASSAGGGVVSMLGSLGGMLPDVATLVSAAASAVGFLADHADQLSWILPVLAAGFVAWKAAQAAGNIAALASVPIQAAQVVSNIALAAAIRASGSASTTSAAQQLASSGVVQTSSLKTAATAIATGARVVAGWVLMGAQSLLQAARMAAAWVIAMGPVGWVIAAVIGLVALIVANWDTVTRATGVAWDWVTGKLRGAVAFMVGLFLNFTLVGLIIKHWDTIKSAFSNGVSGAVDFVKGLPGRSVSALGNLGSLLYSAGSDLLMGMVRGIGNVAGRVADAAKDAAKAAVNGVKNFLGIHSPSTVFAGIGENVGQGLVGGMLAQSAAVKRAGMTLAAAAIAIPLTLASPGLTADGGGAPSTLAAAGQVAAAAAASSGPAADGGGNAAQLTVHAYEGQSVRSVATEVVNLGTWSTKGR